MTSTSAAPATGPRVFYGWRIVAVASLAMFFSGPGQTYSVSTFVDPFIQDFGWSRSLVSALYSGGTLVAGCTMLAVGQLTGRWGYRLMLTLVSLLLAASCLFMSGVGAPATLLVGFIFLRIFGQGSLTLLPTSLVPQWFIRKRGRALSLVTLGGLVSSAVVPMIDLAAIHSWGWRPAWQLWSLLLVLIMAPAAWLVVRDRPEAMGLLPDGERADPADGSTTLSSDEAAYAPRQALRLPVFWIVLIAGMMPAMVGTGLYFHNMSILEANGITPAVAAGVFTIAAAVSFPTSFLAGWVCDRWPTRFVFAGALFLHVVALLTVLAATTPAMVVVLGVLRGIDGAFLGLVGGVIWPEYFGRRHLAAHRGIAAMAMVVGSAALGPLPFGVAYDAFGSYTQIVWLMAIPLLAAGAAVLWAKPPGQRASLPAST